MVLGVIKTALHLVETCNDAGEITSVWIFAPQHIVHDMQPLCSQ